MQPVLRRAVNAIRLVGLDDSATAGAVRLAGAPEALRRILQVAPIFVWTRVVCVCVCVCARARERERERERERQRQRQRERERERDWCPQEHNQAKLFWLHAAFARASDLVGRVWASRLVPALLHVLLAVLMRACGGCAPSSHLLNISSLRAEGCCRRTALSSAKCVACVWCEVCGGTDTTSGVWRAAVFRQPVSAQERHGCTQQH